MVCNFYLSEITLQAYSATRLKDKLFRSVARTVDVPGEEQTGCPKECQLAASFLFPQPLLSIVADKK